MSIEVKLDGISLVAKNSNQNANELVLEEVTAGLTDEMQKAGLPIDAFTTDDMKTHIIQQKDGILKHQLIHISIPQHTKVLRFDFNPQTLQGTSYATILASQLQRMRKQGWEMHATRADIAIDLIDEAHSHALEISKNRAIASRERDDLSGSLQTKYYGARGSDVMVRIYDKHAEQRKSQQDRIQARTSRAMTLWNQLNEKSQEFGITFDPSELARQIGLSDILTDLSGQGVDIDLTEPKQFRYALDSLAYSETQKLDDVPKNWWRLEFQLRTEKLKDGLPFDELIKDWLDHLGTPLWESIDNPELRVWMLAWKAKKVRKSDANSTMQMKMNAINKWASIDIYYINKRLKVVKHGVIPTKSDGTPYSNLDPPDTITRATPNSKLVKKIIKTLIQTQGRLNKQYGRYLA